MNFLVANNIYVKKVYTKNSFAYAGNVDGSGVRYMTVVKSAGS